MNISFDFISTLKHAPAIAAIVTAVLVPGELGIKTTAAAVAYGAVNALVITKRWASESKTDANSKAVDQEHNMNTLTTALMASIGIIMLLPTIVNPVASLVIKAILFVLVRRSLHDFAVRTYKQSPFTRFTYTFTATHHKDASKNFVFSI